MSEGAGGRILIIDDSAVILGRLRACLSAEGWAVVTTTQTVGAARYLPTCDLAIVDFYMPGIDGGTVVSALRAAGARGSAAPQFYLYTSDAQKASQYRRYGFDGAFVRKGDDASLVKQVKAYYRTRELRHLMKSGSGRTPPSE